jgi:hypothetical protein
MMGDLISRQAAIDALKRNTFRLTFAEEQNCEGHVAWSAKAVYSEVMEGVLLDLPSAQSDIIRCNACKHWTQTTGNMPGFGLGDCDYLNAKLVSCNGFCYWAERRAD